MSRKAKGSAGELALPPPFPISSLLALTAERRTGLLARACQDEINASVEFREDPLWSEGTDNAARGQSGQARARAPPGSQGVRESRSQGSPPRCRWPVSGRLAVWPTRKKQRSLLAGDGTTGDARDGQGPYRSWQPAGLAGLGARGPGGGRERVSRDGHRQGISIRKD